MTIEASAGWDRHDEVAGLPTFWREAPGAPILYLHGVPTHSDDFLPFLERIGGVAPDLPGFGRSGKPAAFDYSPDGYGRFLAALVERLGLDRCSLVVHDWGVVGLVLPEQLLARVRRLVIVNAVPLLPGYTWHRVARLWRTPVVGELTMGFTTRRGLARGLRPACVDDDSPRLLADRTWRYFDHGTQRAILKLYRSAPPDRLARAGERLRALACPTLVVWGERDPYLPASFAHAYAAAVGGPAQVESIADAGHWPWLDREDVIGRIADFLGAG